MSASYEGESDRQGPGKGQKQLRSTDERWCMVVEARSTSRSENSCLGWQFYETVVMERNFALKYVDAALRQMPSRKKDYPGKTAQPLGSSPIRSREKPRGKNATAWIGMFGTRNIIMV